MKTHRGRIVAQLPRQSSSECVNIFDIHAYHKSVALLGGDGEPVVPAVSALAAAPMAPTALQATANALLDIPEDVEQVAGNHLLQVCDLA